MALQSKFLVFAVRAYLNPAERDSLADLARSFSHWRGLVAEAERQRVSPVLGHVLEGLPAGLIPETVLEDLRGTNEKNSFRSLFLLGELRCLSELFQKNGIPIVALKGPLLATATYGDTGMRLSEDLDILVHPDHALRARDLLMSEGYRLLSNLDWCGDQASDQVYLRFASELHMIRGDVAVDLHWRLFPDDFPFGMDSFVPWGQGNAVMIAGHPVPVLSAEQNLVFLAAHGAKHIWWRLGWICDFARFLQMTPLDWPSAFALAQSAGNTLVLAHALALARDFAAVVLPVEAEKWMRASGKREARSRRIASRIACRILRAKRMRDPTPIEYRLFVLELSSSPREAWRRFHTVFLEPRVGDWLIFPAHSPFNPLYYLLRPVRLSVKFLLGRVVSRLRTSGRSLE